MMSNTDEGVSDGKCTVDHVHDGCGQSDGEGHVSIQWFAILLILCNSHGVLNTYDGVLSSHHVSTSH